MFILSQIQFPRVPQKGIFTKKLIEPFLIFFVSYFRKKLSKFPDFVRLPLQTRSGVRRSRLCRKKFPLFLLNNTNNILHSPQRNFPAGRPVFVGGLIILQFFYAFRCLDCGVVASILTRPALIEGKWISRQF